MERRKQGCICTTLGHGLGDIEVSWALVYISNQRGPFTRCSHRFHFNVYNLGLISIRTSLKLVEN
jgi:hypothetical protein